MKEKISEKIIKNYSTLVDKLEDYSNSEENKEDIEYKDYIFYYDNFIKKKENKEIENDK